MDFNFTQPLFIPPAVIPPYGGITAIYFAESDLDGCWEKSKYGLQLSVERCVEIVPRTKDGITAYLSSGLIKGIGEKTAKDIVLNFGVKSLEVIENEPEKLLTIKGITEKKIKRITESFNQSRDIREIVSYLAPFGITVNKCAKIHDEFGAQTMEILKNRPFELCSISGFGFLTVDAIAKKTSCRPDDPMWIRGALQFALDEAMTSGHLYLEKAELREQAYRLLNEGYESEVVPITQIYSARNFANEEETATTLDVHESRNFNHHRRSGHG